MRLIDADELMKEFDPDGERIDPIFVRAKIVNQPAAYDVDKVLEQLEESRNIQYRQDGSMLSARRYISIDKAVGIVKAGGVNE